MSKISPARRAAFEILYKIETERAFSSILLPQYEEDLSLKDRALCHELTLGVLRKLLYLDHVIEILTHKKKLDTAVRVILRLGLYQLFFLDKIPSHAALNDSVNLVQSAKKTSAKGLVNAVLRRADREKVELKFADEIEKLAVETSHPRWLIEKWNSQFGTEKTVQLARANNEIPPVYFRLTGKTSAAATGNLQNYRPSEFAEGCFLAEKIDSNLLELAERGEIYIQDEGSQMVAQTVNLKKDESFLDLCAAPGGKTTLIGSKFKAQGLNLLAAGDFYGQRVRFLKENCRRQELEFIQIVQFDAENSLPFADVSFDVLLVDAPCSGTGTIRHHPEIRYFLQENDFRELSLKQLKILKQASKLVKPGGRLIYSTCSLENEENEKVCALFAAENPGFQTICPDVPERFLTPQGFARTFPPEDKMDGFFIAVFEKKIVFW